MQIQIQIRMKMSNKEIKEDKIEFLAATAFVPLVLPPPVPFLLRLRLLLSPRGLPNSSFWLRDILVLVLVDN